MNAIPSSYRDPAGFVVEEDGVYKRVVTPRGVADYEQLISSGLNDELVAAGLLVSHKIESSPELESQGSRLLIPEQIPFVSYPFEWSFDELKDAALLTLDIQQRALAHGLVLKDASAYNVQFQGAKPVFIDTLSFTRYHGGAWVAYEQFCRQFLGPLLLMHYGAPDAARFLKEELDGFQLDRVSRSLPKRSYLRSGPLLHIHLHARAVRRQSSRAFSPEIKEPVNLQELTASLRRAVEKIRTPQYDVGWTGYYAESRFYPPGAQDAKREAVRDMAGRVSPRMVFDLGANTGLYASKVASLGALCVAFESDSGCVNRMYLEERAKARSNILPLVMDLANPSPPLGFELHSTMSLFERPQADLVLCLALIHHLRVSGNIPLERIVQFLARLGRWLIIEFVPLTDPAIKTLTSRMGDFADYTLPGFLESFTKRYCLRASKPVTGTRRTLHLFERRPCAA
jgi:ribosomal protein L11 methylase PrmA